MGKTILKILAGLIPALAICAACFIAGSIYHIMANMTTSESAQLLQQNAGPVEPEVPDSLPSDFYMLLLGVDSSTQRETGEEAQFFNGSFRSDSIIVAHVDLEDQKVALLSLERDIKTIIDGYEDDGYQKLNAAYALGGVELMKDEAEDLVGVPIPYYAIVDMTGLTEMIDAFGGIEIDVERAFWDNQLEDGIDEGGLQVLNGQQAVLYSRSRYAWEEGDFARMRHQREVLKSLAAKIMDTSGDLFALYGAAETVSTRVSTNFTFMQIFEIAAKMKGMDTSTDIYSMMTPTDGEMLNGISYQILIDDEWEEILTAFKEMVDPNAPTEEELAIQRAQEAAAAGDPRYVDEDGDGYYDADANLDNIVDDEEWEAYQSARQPS